MSAAVSSGIRLDTYHPTLNTGISDIRIQDAVLEYPIVRALIVPECDLEARRRCIALISNVIKAANPTLHFVLEFRTKPKCSNGPNTNADDKKRYLNDLLTHYKSLSHFLATVPPKEKLVRFWLKHYQRELQAEAARFGPSFVQEMKKQDLQQAQQHGQIQDIGEENSGETSISRMTLTTLYSKIRKARDILQDLADRVQGAVCLVFWESWDATYQQLAEIVSDTVMEATENGRIFRPSGTAAIYINRQKVERRAQLHRQQRQQMMHEKAGKMPSSSDGVTRRSSRPDSEPRGGSLDIKLTTSFQQDKTEIVTAESTSALLTPPEVYDVSTDKVGKSGESEQGKEANDGKGTLKINHSPHSPVVLVSSPKETNKSSSSSSALSTSSAEIAEDDDIQALIDVLNHKQDGGKSGTNFQMGEDDFEGSNSPAWPFKLLTAPVTNEHVHSFNLIDSSELDGVMDEVEGDGNRDGSEPAVHNTRSSSGNNGVVQSVKRKSTMQGKAEPTFSFSGSSELRKRIRLMEEEEHASREGDSGRLGRQRLGRNGSGVDSNRGSVSSTSSSVGGGGNSQSGLEGIIGSEEAADVAFSTVDHNDVENGGGDHDDSNNDGEDHGSGRHQQRQQRRVERLVGGNAGGQRRVGRGAGGGRLKEGVKSAGAGDISETAGNGGAMFSPTHTESSIIW